MKFIIQKVTGLDETCVVELEHLDPPNLDAAFAVLDARLLSTNRKIVEAREFIQQIPSPHYRYLFTTFLDTFLGISSQAESLLRKFKVEAPIDFDKWRAKKMDGEK